MKFLLLLPDFYQSGEINAWSGGMSAPVPVSVCKDIPLRELPDCFVLGIPESLLRVNIEKDFVYAQYVRLDSKRSVLSFSIRGGNDKTGRTVVLTILQLLDEGEQLMFPPEVPSNLPDSISERNAIEDRIGSMLNSLQSDSSSNIKDMISAVKKYPKLRSFASEHVDSLAQKPQWTPNKKKEYSFMVGILVTFLLLMVLIIEL
ncbi:hypothetical protein [Shewanella baltica]|uniref:hypothetical protein n=1 Tax=Shewanella baltica TaxID=62322 RepID=UPI0024BAC76E|nr:hypothetical protein [Shewanella baltica]